MPQAEAGFGVVPHPKECNCGNCTIEKQAKRIEELETFVKAHTSADEGAYADLKRKYEALMEWLDNNTTFFDVDHSEKIEGPNIPILAGVSQRIWYHATDDTESWPFSALIEQEDGDG